MLPASRLVLAALVALAAPAAADIGGHGGSSSCPDDGQVHTHDGGFSACMSVPSLCVPGLPLRVCTPFVCLQWRDYVPIWLPCD